jgi:prolipoprotein diacylglyceryl transferase
MLVTTIPSPPQSVWYVGPVPLRAYALCILVGIFAAVLIGNRLFVARGGSPGQVADVAVWAVPFGVIGGRVYHVLTDWSAYFGEGGKGALGALRIWEGGLGIWGAIALGALGAYIGCQRHRIPFVIFADSVAPGIAVAQAIGRWGNWFNQELFGRPTTLPWALQIDPVHRPAGYADAATFHPVFLYESLACLVIAGLLVWSDARFKLSHGRVFALYVAMYCAARGAIETLRIDESHHVLGVRFNVLTAIVVGILALVYLARTYESHPAGGTAGRRRREPVPESAQDISAEPQSPKRGRRVKGR